MNLRNDLQGKYLSIWEYMNNSFDVFGAFVKKHPLIIFFHFLFSVTLSFLYSFILWTPLGKLYKITLQGKRYTSEYDSLFFPVIICLLSCIIVSGIIELFVAIIRKKIGLEIENRIKEFKVSEIIVKFIIMVFINILIGAIIGISAGMLLKFINPLILVSVIFFILKLNFLYFKQAYYLRDINIIEALKYNFHLIKRKRLVILIPLAIIFFIALLVTQFYGLILELMIKNLLILGILSSIATGIIKTISEIFATTIENVVYLNLEYMDLKKLEDNKFEGEVL